MKKQLLLSAVLVSLFLSTTLVFSHDGNIYLPLKKQLNKVNAQRIIKLGNDQRDLGQYDEALDNLSTGLELAQKTGEEYWIAVAYQYLGLYYRDIDEKETALKYLRKASRIFDRIISDDFDGSQNTIKMYIDQLLAEMPKSKKNSELPVPEIQKGSKGNELGQIKKDIDEIKEAIKKLSLELENIKGLTQK